MGLKLRYWLKRKKPPTYRPVILVTGCGTGIGLAIAELLTRQPRYRVVVTARARWLEVLREKFPETDRVMVRELDIVSSEQRIALLNEVNLLWGGVDILINNAGVSYRSVVEHMSNKEDQHQFDVNYFGAVALIRGVLPYMRELGRGKIINISSVSGMLAMPTMASYSASKHALEGLSEALWYELRPFGIDVCLVQPGFVHSDSFENVLYSKRSDPGRGPDGPYADYYEHMTPFIARLMKLSPTGPDDIARKVLKVIRTERPPLWIPATWDASFFYYLRRFIPRSLLLPFLFRLLPGASKWAQRHTKRRR